MIYGTQNVATHDNPPHLIHQSNLCLYHIAMYQGYSYHDLYI